MGNIQADNALIGVKAEDITGLSEQQLPQLLKILLDNSALLMGVPLGCWHVNADTKAADGGVDASISWSAKPEAIPDWFPGTDVVFQCKACKKFGPTQCSVELLSPKNGLIRPGVRDTLRRGGKYVLVVALDWTDQDRSKRIAAMVDQIARKDPTLPRKNRILIWDAGVLASWVNRFPSAVVQVLSWLRRQPPDGLLTWDLMSRDHKYANPFHASTDETTMIALLRQQLMQHKVWKIVGLPGVGRTRMLVEALRPGDDDDQSRTTPSRSVLYIDEKGGGVDSVRYAWSWVKSLDVSCAFIVDNCGESERSWLAQEVVDSSTRVTLVTVSVPSCDLPQQTTLVLGRMPDDAVKQIVVDCAPSLTYIDVEFAIRQAQGLPGIACTIAVQLGEGDYNVQALMDHSPVETMRAHVALLSDNEKSCLNALSLFSRVGYRDSLKAESEHVAKVFCHDTNADVFLEAIETLTTKGYAKKQYGYAIVSQDLLADRLAYEWWRQKELPSTLGLMDQLPDDLRVSFCERLSRLCFFGKATQAIEKFCDRSGLLSDSAYLTTDSGARLLSAVAECNPLAAARSLSHAFASFTPEKARDAMESTGALVEAMAKLCWWPQCFDLVAPVFLVFAAGDTTSHRHQVAEQYADLFRWVLPGTQTPLLDRLSVLDGATGSPFEACRVLGVTALCNALTTGQIVGSMEILNQGGRRPQFDYWPRSRDEINSYWHEITIRLNDSLRSKEIAVRDAAATGLVDKVPELVENGFQEIAEPIVRAIIEDAREHLPALRNRVIELLDSPREFDKPRLESWLRDMEPTSLDERIRTEVLGGPEYLRSTDLQNSVDNSLTDLAAYCNDHGSELTSAIPLLLESTDSPGPSIVFGSKLGTALRDPWVIVDRLLDTIPLLSQPVEKVNVGVMGGLLASLRTQDTDRVELVLDRMRDDGALLPFLVDTTLWSEPGYRSLQRCMHAAEEGDIKVSSLRRLTYQYVLKGLEPDDLATMAASVRSLGTPEALNLSLSLLCNYASAHDEKPPLEVRLALKALLMDHRLMGSLRTGQHLDWFWWNRSVIWLLHEQDDQELATDLVSQLLSDSGTEPEDSERSDHDVDEAAPVLLKEYWPTVWALVQESVAKRGLPAATRARIAFASRERDDSDLETGFSQITLQEAREWCGADQEHAPLFLLDLLPIGVRKSESDGYTWNEVARYVVDTYGQNTVVQAIVGNRLRDILGWVSRGRSAKLVADLYRQLETSTNAVVQRWARSIRSELEAQAERIDKWATRNEDDNDAQ
ncbi:hypothetical protein [Candidatus Cryosericum septentrionale]|jgi:hypothetical protein|uniref:Uncharacterized protein n=1 Tax=Candidatus Cryosericum septentrionale TaxID=2290913 RepID=A0A398DXR7_9BACT|nr:hypothetical protein [Candidatus Cryosericum septentrionale]RIE16104.1 hypothetical protein SMC1_08575 [Candidatus Cryosericum septentrionale]